MVRSFLKTSAILHKAISKGLMIIEPLEGASKLSYKARIYQSLVCNVYALLDNDDEGRRGYDEAVASNLVTDKEVRFASLLGYKNSEFEDLLEAGAYKNEIEEKYNILLRGNVFRNSKFKWSDRIKKVFIKNGARFDDAVEMEVKDLVAEKVQRIGMRALSKNGKMVIKSFIAFLEKKVS